MLLEKAILAKFGGLKQPSHEASKRSQLFRPHCTIGQCDDTLTKKGTEKNLNTSFQRPSEPHRAVKYHHYDHLDADCIV